jgi:hypothetical protein
LATFALNVQADKQVQALFPMEMKVDASVQESGCKNNRGPTITMSGKIHLGALNARVIFKNNAKGTHETSVVASYEVAMLPAGEAIVIPKQPVRGGVGGNPHISLVFHDGSGTDLSDEFYLGRCVQGMKVNADLLSAALAHANVRAGRCNNRRGPYVTLSGNLVLSGLHARFIFRNNVKGTHTAEDSRDVAIVLDGSSITLPKQPVRGGVGGNPLISIQFLDGKGEPIGDEVDLGRCVKL